MGVLNLGIVIERAMYTSAVSIPREVSGYMARFFHRDLPVYWRKGCNCFLAFFWLTGLLSGMAAYICAGGSLTSVMRGACFEPVSIVSLLCVTTLPFLFSAFAVYISEPRLLLLVCFGKAFLFSFVSLGVMHSFGSAGWLIRLLLCFSSTMTAPVLYLYWLRHLSGKRGFRFGETVLMLALCLLIGSVDYRLVSPFLAGLIN